MKKFLLILFLILNFSIFNSAYATSFVGGDLTYTCLGGSSYLITFSYYRDCSGSVAPTSPQLNFNCSSNPSFNFSTSLVKIPGTGQEVTPGCGCDSSTCIGGTAFGVREYVYQSQVTLVGCNSWKMYVGGCCRNAVTTINGGTTNAWYMEATLNNSIAPSNSSPTFSNKPIAIVCNNKSYCFNHGAIDPDGDSLVYSFSSPKKTSASVVAYNSTWTVSNFLSATFPGITLDPITGDICFTPTMNMSSITGVKIEEWRTINGVATLIGTIFRDIQFHVKTCANSIPVLSGIDTLNTHTYNPNDTIHYMSWAIGQSIDFDINGYDADTVKPGCNAHPERFSILWNNGIPAGTFTPSYNGTDSAFAHFHWQPSFSDVASSPHCFIATIKDKACPYMGVSTSKYCLTITSGVGIEIKKLQQILNIYPNPSSGLFEINFSTNSVTNCLIHIYNTEGKEVYQQEWKQPNLNSNHKLDLSNLTNGVYYVSINQGDTIIKSKIVIKK